MGFKNAWKLVSINSPLLGINQFFFSTKGISFLQREKKPKK